MIWTVLAWATLLALVVGSTAVVLDGVRRRRDPLVRLDEQRAAMRQALDGGRP